MRKKNRKHREYTVLIDIVHDSSMIRERFLTGAVFYICRAAIHYHPCASRKGPQLKLIIAFIKSSQEIIDCKETLDGSMAIVIVLVAVVLAAFCNISIRIFNIPDKADAIVLRVSYLFVRIRKEIHIKRDQDESVAFIEYKKNGEKKKLTGLKSLYRLYRKYKGLPLSLQEKWIRAIRYITKRVHIYIQKLRIKIGSEDAFLTSIAAGLLLIVLNSVFVLTGKFESAKKSEVKVFPVYGREVFNMDLDCIIHIKPVHIIIGYFKYLLKRR